MKSPIKLFKEISPTSTATQVTAKYYGNEVIQYQEYEIAKKVINDLADKIVDDIYPDVIKAIDKELIVKEVSAGISEKVLESMYGKLGKK